MSDPIGQNTYKGLGAPLFGESVIRQRNSSNAILTLMHSTHNAGRLLMGMDSKGDGIPNFGDGTSHITDLAVFDIDADGGYRAVSGTTIKMELNSSGLWSAVGNVLSASGANAFKMKREVAVTSNSTTIVTSNAGKIYWVSTGTNSSVVLKLPTSAATGLDAGMTWEVFCHTTAAGVVDIAAIGANTGAASSQRILCHHGTTNVIETSGAVTNDSSGPFWARIICDTSGAAPVFIIANMMGRNGISTGSFGGFAAGSTALT